MVSVNSNVVEEIFNFTFQVDYEVLADDIESEKESKEKEESEKYELLNYSPEHQIIYIQARNIPEVVCDNWHSHVNPPACPPPEITFC